MCGLCKSDEFGGILLDRGCSLDDTFTILTISIYKYDCNISLKRKRDTIFFNRRNAVKSTIKKSTREEYINLFRRYQYQYRYQYRSHVTFLIFSLISFLIFYFILIIMICLFLFV